MRSSIARDPLAQRLSARYAALKWPLRILFTSSFGLILFMSCSPPVIRTATYAAADSLDLSITVSDQYNTAASRVTINIAALVSGNSVLLENPLSLTCDGVALFANQRTGAFLFSLPRQPAGGAYQCFYSDGKGNITSLTLPIPPGTLAITAPAAGATVPIPANTATPTTPTTPDQPQPVFIGTLTIHYTLPTPPADATTHIGAEAICGSVPTAQCGYAHGTGATNPGRTGAYELIDKEYAPGYGFERFVSGASGEIELFCAMSWSLAPGGFQSVKLNYTDTISIPVTWSKR